MIVKRLLPLILLASLGLSCKLLGGNDAAPTVSRTDTPTVNAEATPTPANISVPLPSAPTPTPTPKPQPKAVPPPDGATVARCNGQNVTLRSGPRQDSQALGSLKQGQRLYLIKYSDNYDNINGIDSNWAYIQTEEGKKGWVFGHYVQ
jgi:hypothetical protein